MNRILMEQSQRSRSARIAGLVIPAVGALILAGCATLLPGEREIPAGHRRNVALYLTMRDGVRIAADVWYPADLAPGQRIPALVRATRYGRAYRPGVGARIWTGMGLPRPEEETFATEPLNRAGYAVVAVDTRGSGASFGGRTVEWSDAEVEDLGEVVDWIVAQPWSNGRVGAFGVSYDGTCAELLASLNHPAVRAVAPLFSNFDVQYQLATPGGVFNRWFIGQWGRSNQARDAGDIFTADGVTGFGRTMMGMFVTGLKPVDEDPDGRLLEQALAARRNIDVERAFRTVEFRDDPIGPGGETATAVSPAGRRKAIERSGVPMYLMAGWLDSCGADGALSRYLTSRNPQTLLIGPWSHGGRTRADPFRSARARTEPPVKEQLRGMIAFFDAWLKDGGARPPEPGIRYYTFGEGSWRSTSTWPPPGTAEERWYFGPERSLLPAPPPPVPDGFDSYTVDFTASSGDANRWHTPHRGPPVRYTDRAGEDRKLLCYTSAPLQADVSITGSPVVHLQVASTLADTAFHVYLEEVDPRGKVTYITEGILRALHRRISSGDTPFTPLGPWHSFERASAEPLLPGEAAEVSFGLYATSVLVRRGHRLRVAIAGHDASVFARYPESGTPVLTVWRLGGRSSGITLPVRAHEMKAVE
jgi:hypothetical protein